MGMSGVSKSQVSRLCPESLGKDIDVRVKAFLERPIEGDRPFVWLDATYLKARQHGRIVSVAAIVAVGANTAASPLGGSEPRREILGLAIGPSEVPLVQERSSEDPAGPTFAAMRLQAGRPRPSGRTSFEP